MEEEQFAGTITEFFCTCRTRDGFMFLVLDRQSEERVVRRETRHELSSREGREARQDGVGERRVFLRFIRSLRVFPLRSGRLARFSSMVDAITVAIVVPVVTPRCNRVVTTGTTMFYD